MNKTTRLLSLTGMGVFAALAIGAGPAQAAGSSATTPAPKTVAQHHGWDRTVGYYRSARACEIAGHIGERVGRWDDHDCNFLRFGFRRGEWALSVSNSRDWNSHGHDFHGHNFHGHTPRPRLPRPRLAPQPPLATQDLLPPGPGAVGQAFCPAAPLVVRKAADRSQAAAPGPGRMSMLPGCMGAPQWAQCSSTRLISPQVW